MYYTSITSTIIYADGDSVLFIPADDANPYYQRYLEWLEEGNTPEPWNPEITDGS